jgi:hypothetical protein
MGNGLTRKGAIRRALGATEPDIRKSRKRDIINIRADRVRDQLSGGRFANPTKATTLRSVRNYRADARHAAL